MKRMINSLNSSIILEIGALIFADIALCVGLILGTSNDDLPRPRLVCGLLFPIFAIVAGYLLWRAAVGWFFIISVFILNFIFGLFIYYLTKARDVGGINVGELTLKYMSSIDEAICYIADCVSNRIDPDETSKSIEYALLSILTQIGDILHLNPSRGAQLAIFRAGDGKFKVISEVGLSVEQVDVIERNFRYTEPLTGLAGHSLFERKTIGIKNLASRKDPDCEKWTPTFSDQKRKGSIICMPILRGIGRDDSRNPMGVLNVASTRKGLLATPTIRSFLNRYANKIEILLYCQEMIDAYQTKRSQNLRI
jgi:hypothetical protein